MIADRSTFGRSGPRAAGRDRPSADPAPERLAAIDRHAVGPDVFVAGDRVIHAWYRDGLQASKLAGQLIDRGLGVTATARNWNTVRKLVELAGQD